MVVIGSFMDKAGWGITKFEIISIVFNSQVRFSIENLNIMAIDCFSYLLNPRTVGFYYHSQNYKYYLGESLKESFSFTKHANSKRKTTVENFYSFHFETENFLIYNNIHWPFTGLSKIFINRNTESYIFQ